jgi:hypothetical protein
VSLIGFKTDLSKVWKPRGLLPRASLKGLKTDLFGVRKPRDLRETEKNTQKKNTKSTLHLPLGFRMVMIKDDFFGVFCGVFAT